VAFNIDPVTDTIAFYTTRKDREDPSPLLLKVTIDKNTTPPELTNLSDILFNIAMVNEELTAGISGEKVIQTDVGANVPTEKKAVITTDTLKTAGPELTEVTKPEPTGKIKPEKAKTTEPEEIKSIPTLQALSEKHDVTSPGSDSLAISGNLKSWSKTATDKVVYRVQFASSMKSKSPYTVKVNGKTYRTWQYYYKGAYRQCIGNFDTLGPAVDLQNSGRTSGLSQAFVVVFVNGKRSVDPKYFR
jgi:hypothetical protein